MNRNHIFLGALVIAGVAASVNVATSGGKSGADGAYVPSELEVQYGVCVQCHGAHGEGRPELGAPRIGDLDTAYIQYQLSAFRRGDRGAHPGDGEAWPMGAVGRGLPEAIIPELSAFVNGLDPAPQPPGPRSARGAAVYQACVTCHGSGAAGKAAQLAPALLHQDPAYLTRQLEHYREGVRAQGLSQAMVAQAVGLSDADIEAVVAHIVSLRPELPPLDNPPVTRSRDEGLAAWADIYKVATHPRCMNCHPDGDAPLQGDDSHAHIYGITRFSPLEGVHCNTCHAPGGVGDGLAPLPPADAIWSMPPKAMAFENRSSAALCVQLKDPSVNGGRGFNSLTHHVEADHLLITSWHSGRDAPHISHPELVKRFQTWAEAGGPCPESL